MHRNTRERIPDWPNFALDGAPERRFWGRSSLFRSEENLSNFPGTSRTAPPSYDSATGADEPVTPVVPSFDTKDPKTRIFVKKSELLINGISLSSLRYEGNYRGNVNDFYKLQYVLGQANGPFSNGIEWKEFNEDSYIMAFSAATSPGGQEGLTVPASRSGTCRLKIQFSGNIF